MSSAMTLRSRSDSGTSPETMRWARPSTIAVLPTPGSPIRTGLFLVRRERTWMTRRISSSRPMTGSSLPCSAASVRSRPNFSSAWYLSSGFWSVTRWGPRTSVSACQERVLARAGAPQRLPRRPVALGEREQQVLGGDVLVVEVARLALGARGASGSARWRCRSARRRPPSVGSASSAALFAARMPSGWTPSFWSMGSDDAGVLLEQHGEQVLGRHLRVVALLGAGAGRPGWPPGT